MLKVIHVWPMSNLKCGYSTNTNTNVLISNQGPIKGKIITMINYIGTMCNVYTQYNVTIK